jgi:hypothetical protein
MRALTICTLLTLAVAGCDLDLEHDLDDEIELGTHRHELTGTPLSSCVASGGSTWCQDYYSAKWCTNSYWTSHIWDRNTGCDWHGWDRQGRLYCYHASGWLYSTYSHRHCN